MVELERPQLPLLTVLTFATLAIASPLSAQLPGGIAFGVSGSGNLFVGNDGSDFLDGGFGIDAYISRSVGPHLRLRGDAMTIALDGWSIGNETADNRVVVFGAGPEFSAGIVWAELYVRGIVGIAGNVQSRTNSVLKEDGTWALTTGAGAGVRFRLGPSVALDVGGDVLKLGELEFAQPGLSSLMGNEAPALLRLRAGLRFTVP